MNVYLRRLRVVALRSVGIGALVAAVCFAAFSFFGDYVAGLAAGVVGVGMVGAALWNLPPVLNPRWHRSYRALRAYGDPAAVCEHVALEMMRGGRTVCGVQFTTEWILVPTEHRFDAVLPRDVLWIYPRTVTHRTNGIKTGTTYNAVIVTRYRKLLLKRTQDEVQQVLHAVHQFAPWAEVGYSKELERHFKKKRIAVTAAQIDLRREQMATA